MVENRKHLKAGFRSYVFETDMRICENIDVMSCVLIIWNVIDLFKSKKSINVAELTYIHLFIPPKLCYACYMSL